MIDEKIFLDINNLTTLKNQYNIYFEPTKSNITIIIPKICKYDFIRISVHTNNNTIEYIGRNRSRISIYVENNEKVIADIQDKPLVFKENYSNLIVPTSANCMEMENISKFALHILIKNFDKKSVTKTVQQKQTQKYNENYILSTSSNMKDSFFDQGTKFCSDYSQLNMEDSSNMNTGEKTIKIDLETKFEKGKASSLHIKAIPEKENKTKNLIDQKNVFNQYPHEMNQASVNETFLIAKSKQTILYPGLLNQGATCYMNSFLQALFHLPAFRRSIFMLPDETIAKHPALYGLYDLFSRMQRTTEPVSTLKLTKTFGWDRTQLFRQNDAQEFSRILLDHVIETTKESKIQNLFKGELTKYIKGDGVDKKKKEEFMDISLDVNHESLELALSEYTSIEQLSGDNKYVTEDGRKIDAEIGTMLTGLPPILQIHLQRLSFNTTYQYEQLVSSKLEYHADLILGEVHYRLFGVVIHSGSAKFGHFYAYLRPGMGDWFKFNDSVVEAVDEYRVLSDGVGGWMNNRYAYILYYVRSDMIDEIFCEVPDTLIRSVEKPDILICDRSLRSFGSPVIENEKKEKIKYDKDEYIDEKKKEERDWNDEDMIEFLLYNEDAFREAAAQGLVGICIDEKRAKHLRISRVADCQGLAIMAAKEIGFELARIWRIEESGEISPVKSTESVARLPATLLVESIQSNDEIDIPSDSILLFIKMYSPKSIHPLFYIGSIVINRNGSLRQIYQPVKNALHLEDSVIFVPYMEGKENYGLITKCYEFSSMDKLKNGDCIVLSTNEEIDPSFVNSGIIISESTQLTYADIMINSFPQNVVDYYKLRNNTIELNAVMLNVPDSIPYRIKVPKSIDGKSIANFYALVHSINLDRDEAITAFAANPKSLLPECTLLKNLSMIQSDTIYIHITSRLYEDKPLSIVNLMDGNQFISQIAIREFLHTYTRFDDVSKALGYEGVGANTVASITKNNRFKTRNDSIYVSDDTIFYLADLKMYKKPMVAQKAIQQSSSSKLKKVGIPFFFEGFNLRKGYELINSIRSIVGTDVQVFRAGLSHISQIVEKQEIPSFHSVYLYVCK